MANRGDIARACRDTSFGSVAVYADPDRDGLHVRMTDEAVPLGGTTPTDSYLDFSRVLRAAGQDEKGLIGHCLQPGGRGPGYGDAP
jgi:acetyl-CoA/propionyl-CoA carboxylase biotin carboxyl carrier protein